MAPPFACLLFPVLVGAFVIAQVSGQQAEPIPVSVDGPGGKPVRILFQAQDYEGPFDPLDPKGVQAAQRRGMAVAGKNGIDAFSSFIPPGALKMLTKDLKKVIMNEGKRFALHHPIETAELAGIATKLNAFLKTTANRVKSEARKERMRNLRN